MKTVRVLLLSAVLLRATSLHAGNEFGNGGDVIVCPDGSVTFYDWYETGSRHGWAVQSPGGTTLEQKVEALLNRMLPLNPFKARHYKAEAAKFWTEAKFIPNGQRLVDVPDTGSGFIPANCKIEQLVVQAAPLFPGEKRFTFDQDYWDRLPLEQKAAVVVHEIILRDATERSGQQNSVRTRYFNSLILADKVRDYSSRDWTQTMGLIGLSSADAFGFYLENFRYDTEDNTFRGEISSEMHGMQMSFGPISGTLFSWGQPHNNQNSFWRSSSRGVNQLITNDFFVLKTDKLPGIGTLNAYANIGSTTWYDDNTVESGSAELAWADMSKLVLPNSGFDFSRGECADGQNPSRIHVDFVVQEGQFKISSAICWTGRMKSIQGFEFDNMKIRNRKPVGISSDYWLKQSSYVSLRGGQMQNWAIAGEFDQQKNSFPWPFHPNGNVKLARCRNGEGFTCRVAFADGSVRDVAHDSVCEFDQRALAKSCR